MIVKGQQIADPLHKILSLSSDIRSVYKVKASKTMKITDPQHKILGLCLTVQD